MLASEGMSTSKSSPEERRSRQLLWRGRSRGLRAVLERLGERRTWSYRRQLTAIGRVPTSEIDQVRIPRRLYESGSLLTWWTALALRTLSRLYGHF